VNYFSGFLFQNEQELFSRYITTNDFDVCGFSYGAIKAFEYALNAKHRVDRLMLLSPAFFQDKPTSFKRAQTLFFKTNQHEYIQKFIQNVSSQDNDIDLAPYICQGKQEQLEELLYYTWCGEKLQSLKQRGIKIEVFIGEKDAIINPHEALNFFSQYATTYLISNKGHLLDVS